MRLKLKSAHPPSVRELRPYQRKALTYLLTNNGGALFMEMRLGKTIVAIRAAKAQRGRLLVIAPKSTLETVWRHELVAEGIEDYTAAGDGVVILGYEFATRHPSLILERYWGTVIIDESRRIANPRNRIWKVLSKLKAKCKIVLSGNPAPESYLEYFNQMQFVNESFMGCTNYYEFRYRYFRQDWSGYNWQPKPGVIDKIKLALKNEAFVLTRKDAGIDREKVYETREITMPSRSARKYKRLMSEFILELKNGSTEFVKWTPVQFIRLHMLASGFIKEHWEFDDKIDELIELITDELADEQVVVWFSYTASIYRVAQRLVNAFCSYSLIVGGMSSEYRAGVVADFASGKHRVLLCQSACAGVGIDLSAASTAIYFTSPLSLNLRTQSEDRILHPKKTDPLLYIDLITKDTVDRDVYDLLREKKYNSRFMMTRLLEKFNLRG